MITEVPLMAQVVVYASHDSFRCVTCRVFCRALSRPTKDLLIIRGSLLIIATSKVVVYASHDSFRCVT